MKQKQSLMLLLGVVLMLVVAACSTGSGNAGQVQSTSETVALKAAPAFEVETISGKTVNTETYKNEGKPMIVYFMASTCSTCAKNWKNIDEVYPEYKDKIDLVAISVDPTDDKELLTKLAEEKGFTFETVPGSPRIAVDYEVKKQTAKFAIDKDGNIVSRHDGVLSPEEWVALFESVL